MLLRACVDFLDFWHRFIFQILIRCNQNYWKTSAQKSQKLCTQRRVSQQRKQPAPYKHRISDVNIADIGHEHCTRRTSSSKEKIIYSPACSVLFLFSLLITIFFVCRIYAASLKLAKFLMF